MSIKALYIDELLGMTMVKLLHLKTGCINTITVKVIRNVGLLDVTDIPSDQFIFNKNDSLGELDVRSIGYYKVKQSNIQHHLESYYECRPLQALCEEINKLTNTLRRQEQKATDPFPWLAEVDKRRNLSDREMSEKYVNL